ncbi:MAG: HDOD domain-containing protein [Rhodocyclaceae bacterium]|nr:HDOD domain-containing protein [Rhodocyclaceae bacterium]
MHSAQELVHCMDRLASLPPVFHRIQVELDSPDGSITTLSQLISSDPALAAVLLKVANSALFGFANRIDTISRAVTVLGMQQVRELSIAILVTRTFTSLHSRHVDPEQFWRNSLLRAVACRAAFRVSSGQREERGFVTGLLAHLGHMVMVLSVPELAIAAANEVAEGGGSLIEAERRVIGCDHAEVGGCLADAWGLPPSISLAIAFQYQPRLAGSEARDAWMLFLANQVVAAEERQLASEEIVAELDPEVWERTHLHPENFSALREEAELNLASALSLFYPRAH